MTTLTRSLRQRLATGSLLMAPGAFDPLSAMLVEDAGYDAVYLTGGGFSRANGLPDIGLMTMTEVVSFVDRVCDAVLIPVIADLDNGYGNAVNVGRAVRSFEKAGVAAFHIEDQVSPKKCGHYDNKAVVPVGEMVGKIKAAVDARRDDDLVIVARTDARAIEGFDSALDRVCSYLDAGADLGFVEAPQSVAELQEIPTREPRASMVNIFEGGKTPFASALDLESWGYQLAIYPSQMQRSAVWAMCETLKTMKETGSSAAVASRMISFADREQIVRTPKWLELDRRYAADRIR
jgi:2-methylisocitrate lyase-like PEP mutase family enzyme